MFLVICRRNETWAVDHSNVFLSKPECTWASHLQLLGMLAHVPPSVALPSAQKITLVVLFVTSSNCGRSQIHLGSFFQGGFLVCLSFLNLFFLRVSKFPPAPEFGTHLLDVPTYFLAHLQSSLGYLLLQLFLWSLSREFPAILPQEENNRNSQPAVRL